MRILEKFVMGKQGTVAQSEDVLILGENFVGVVDGCSCRFQINYGDKTPGQIAAAIAKEAILQMPAEVTALEACQYINSEFVSWYKVNNIYEEVKKDRSKRCSCYFSLYSVKRKEIWVLGDCQALVNGQLITSKKTIDTLHEMLRSFLIRVLIEKGNSEESLLERQEELKNLTRLVFESQPLFQNSEDELFGFSCIDGFFRPSKMLQVISIPDDIETLVLASDGYPKLCDTLRESEENLQALIARDPLCYKENCSVKGVLTGNVSFDDRSYVRLSIC